MWGKFIKMKRRFDNNAKERDREGRERERERPLCSNCRQLLSLIGPFSNVRLMFNVILGGLEITCLLEAAGLTMNEMSLVLESKSVLDGRSSAVESRILTSDLNASACIYPINESSNGSAKITA